MSRMTKGKRSYLLACAERMHPTWTIERLLVAKCDVLRQIKQTAPRLRFEDVLMESVP